MRDLLGVRLGFSDQWLHAQLQLLRVGWIKAKIDLTRIDQVVALSPCEVEAVKFAAIERISGDGQCLALRTSLLNPIVRTSGSRGPSIYSPRMRLASSTARISLS